MPSITITTTTEQAQRVQAAFQRYWGMDTPPTEAQVKDWLIRQLRDVVLRQERAVAEAALTPPALFDPT